MHQYTADLANRMAAEHDVHIIGPQSLPRDRYAPEVTLHTPIANRSTGFSREGLDVAALRRLLTTLDALTSDPRPLTSIVHFTSPHLWNPWLLRRLGQRGIPALHTLHDLDPHPGTPFGGLIRPWNRLVQRQADHIIVHGERYRQRLIASGHPAGRVTYLPLLHLFLSHSAESALRRAEPAPVFEKTVLFFGRLLPYKGIAELLTAWASLGSSVAGWRLILAGPGRLADLWPAAIPTGVEVRDRLIDDAEASDLFRQCGLLVLPYVDATQSALVPAAYFFHKPVIVADTGALAEYVQPGRTGWVVPPSDPTALAAAMAAAMSDENRLARMGEAGRAWYDAQRRVETAGLFALYDGRRTKDEGR